MKTYNQDSKDGYLEFYGYDFQNPEVDLYVVHEFLKQHDISHPSEAIEAFLAGEFRFKEERMSEVFEELSRCREIVSDENVQNCIGIDRIRKCIDNVFRAKELAAISTADSVSYGTYRDKRMAENVRDISESVGYPIMITGHNGHVGYGGSYVKTMGAYLAEYFGNDYFVIGTDYFKTTASIQSGNGRKNYTSYSGDPLAYQTKHLGTYYLRFLGSERE